MGWICVLAEKPSVARDIARVLGAGTPGKGCLKGNGYVVTWAVGHLVTQRNPDEIDPRWKQWRPDTLPILPDSIPLKVIPDARAAEQYRNVASILNAPQVDRVICATDAGREGELIFRRIYSMCGCLKPFSRLWISSMTEEAISEGFSRLKDGTEYDALYRSAQCRADADWLVGMNGSRAFTLRYDSLLSVGRVQTPTLSLLVSREQEIRAFVPEEYWEVIADFGAYKGTYIDAAGKTRLPNPDAAERIAQAVRGQEGQVESVKTERKRVPPPLLYDLTTLQREANARYGLTAQATLELAQSLYEKYKVLTYPRTDSRHLPHDMRPKIQKVFSLLPEPYRALVPTADALVDPGKRVYDDAKLTDHHAIVPTGRDPGSLPPAEQRIYDMVARRLLAAFYPDMVYDAMTAVTLVGAHRFLSKGRAVAALGWQAVQPPPRSPKKDQEEPALPQLARGQSVRVQDAAPVKKKTTPPPPYNENTLLGAMENAGRFVEDEDLRRQLKERGLGTPATRAAIIERLIEVGYVRREKKALLPTDKGMKLIAVVPEQMSSPETTGRWEKGLSDIAKGKMDPEKFMASIRRYCAFLCQYATGAPMQDFPKRAFKPRAKSAKKTAAKSPAPRPRKGGKPGGKGSK
ncbi:MAG: DNA topoisomerase 3 [Candidatus Spyradocola sp.]|jgi:DNA topoisomerase-3